MEKDKKMNVFIKMLCDKPTYDNYKALKAGYLQRKEEFIKESEEKWKKKHPIKTFFAKLFKLELKMPNFEEEFNQVAFESIHQEEDLEERLLYLRNISPDFNTLWDMADFIKYIERIYFYNNSNDEKLYSSKNFKEGENGFVVKDLNKLYTIVVKLIANGYTTMMEVRNNKTGSSYVYYFKNNEWHMEYTEIEELAVEYAQKIIMESFVDLFEKIYKLK